MRSWWPIKVKKLKKSPVSMNLAHIVFWWEKPQKWPDWKSSFTILRIMKNSGRRVSCSLKTTETLFTSVGYWILQGFQNFKIKFIVISFISVKQSYYCRKAFTNNHLRKEVLLSVNYLPHYLQRVKLLLKPVLKSLYLFWQMTPKVSLRNRSQTKVSF